MARYTDILVATLRQRYEGTAQPLHVIATEFEISTRTLERLVTREGWSKRSLRPRGQPVAVCLLEQATALAQSAHSRESGNPVLPNDAETELRGPLGPRLRGDERSEDASALLPTPTPTLPLSGGGSELSLIDRLEQLVVQQIAAEEAARTRLDGKRRGATASERGARTLATLTQTLQAPRRLRAGDAADAGPIDDDDMPTDIDEFRRDLARRIDAFVASRTDAAAADAEPGPTPVDEAG